MAATRKNIIFFGRTGSGKSTIANMVLQGKLLGGTQDTFKTDNSVFGVTLQCNMAENDIYRVYDTVGLGETPQGSISDQDAKEQIIKYLKNLKVKFDHICIVIRAERITTLDFAIYSVARFIFDGALENMVIIVTSATKSWLNDNNEYINQVYGNINRCAVNFPPVSITQSKENDNIKTRNFYLKELYKFLDETKSYPRGPKICFQRDEKIREAADKIRSFLYEAFAAIRTIASVALLVLNILGLAGVT